MGMKFVMTTKQTPIFGYLQEAQAQDLFSSYPHWWNYGNICHQKSIVWSSSIHLWLCFFLCWDLSYFQLSKGLGYFDEHAVYIKELHSLKYRHDLKDALCEIFSRVRISIQIEAHMNFLTDQRRSGGRGGQLMLLCFLRLEISMHVLIWYESIHLWVWGTMLLVWVRQPSNLPMYHSKPHRI